MNDGNLEGGTMTLDTSVESNPIIPTATNDDNQNSTENTNVENAEKKPAKKKAPAKKPAEKKAKAPKAPKPKAEKKAPAKKEKLTDDELKAEEKALKAKYPDQTIVKDSIADIGAAKDLRGEAVDAKFRKWNKRTVVIKCQWPGCKETRRIATSDLAQVKFCEAHTIESRKERRRASRAKVAKPAKKPKAK